MGPLSTRQTNAKRYHYRTGSMVIIAIVALAFYALNLLSPEYHDDFIYKFMFVNGGVDYTSPIHSLSDIFCSQIEHYHAVNGRSIVHSLVQLFSGILGKQVFNILNVIVFVVFIGLLMRNIKQRSQLLAIFITLALTLLMPRFKDTFLWMTGGVNYLWSATAALAFLMLYENRKTRPADKSLIWLLPLSFALGWSHEGITLPLACSPILLSLPTVKKNYHYQGLWLALAFLAGACMIVFAPGTIARTDTAAEGFSASSIGLKIINGFSVLGELKIIYIAVVLWVLLWLKNRRMAREVFTDNVHLPLAALLSAGIVFAAGMASPRTAFGLELFSMVFALRVVDKALPLLNEKAIKWCSIGLAIGLTVFYGLLLYHTIPSWQESQRLANLIEHNSDGIIGTQEYDAGIFNQYIGTMISRDATANAINYNPQSWPKSIAATYHRDSLMFLPQAFLDDLKAHPERFKELDKDTPFEFYVKLIDECAAIEEVRFMLSPTDFSTLPFLFRPIARKMNRYKQNVFTTEQWTTIHLYGQRYLFIKKNHNLDSRVKDVEIIESTHPTTNNAAE